MAPTFRALTRPGLLCRLILAGMLLPAIPAVGEVQVLSQLRLGEVDTKGPGSAATLTWDSVQDNWFLIKVSSSGVQYAAGGAVSGSTICVDCSGGGLTGPLVAVPADNWGIEAWVSSDNPALTGVIAYNGDSGSRGMGLYQHEGYYRGLVGGAAFVGTAAITSQWTHLALVVSGGTTYFFVNGSQVASGPPPTPPAPGDALNVGNRRDRAEPLDGRVDEVRLFTFTQGVFSPADLQVSRVYPWPAATRFPTPVPQIARAGSISVTMEPESLTTGWRLAGEKHWRANKSTADGLTPDGWTIEYRPAPGFRQPVPETITLTLGSPRIDLYRTYNLGGQRSASLKVNLLPQSLTLPATPPDQRARWRLAGDPLAAWVESGATLGGLQAGQYLIECSPVPGRTPPPVLTATIFDDEPVSLAAAYSPEVPAAGATMVPLSYSTVEGAPGMPLGCVGQLRSDTTTGTGFAIRTSVVATAANVVFDDTTLAGVTGMQWLQRRDRGVHEPRPALPRGFFLLSGYADQRVADQAPGTASSAASNRNAAALFFVGADANRVFGYAGEMPEISPANSILSTATQKFFAGYQGEMPKPFAAESGRMHAHLSSTAAFAHVTGRTYVTDGFTCLPGGAGSPLFVRFTSGTWHPAAILTGGAASTTVCAIDAEVTQLFIYAMQATGVVFNPSGGVTITQSLLSGTNTAVGGLRVVLEPAGLTTNATWTLAGDNVPRRSGARLLNLAPGSRTIRLSGIPGMIAPGIEAANGASDVSASLTAGELTTVTATYLGITSQPVSRFVTPGTTVTLSVGTTGVPDSWQWKRGGVPIPGATSRTWTKEMAAVADAGIYSVRVGFGTDLEENARYVESQEAAVLVGNNGPIEAWRLAWFGSSANSGSAADTADPDGDGSTNLAEYAAATNPASTADVFRILAASRTPSGFTVIVPGKTGRRYRLERSANPAVVPWTTVATGLLRSVDGSETLRDEAPPAANSCYRVRVSTP